MPVIALATPKGGAGKTTSAVVLASELARSGGHVALLDADPRQRVTRWASKGGVPDTLEIVSNVTEDTIIATIESKAAETQFVIVDLEGAASLMVAYAISRADLVIIPTQGSQMDAEDAVDAISLVTKQEKAFRRRIPYALLITRTSAAVRSRTLRSIIAQLDANNIPRFRVELYERDAFKALFSFGGTLDTLDSAQVPGIKDAINNAHAFVAEVLERLVDNAGSGKAEEAAA